MTHRRWLLKLLVCSPQILEFYNLPAQVQDLHYRLSRPGARILRSTTSTSPRVRRGLGWATRVRVGGGLSNEPHLAVKLNAFVRADQAIAVVHGITELFRRQQGLRESRDRARMKYLFLKEGWTPDSFLAELESIIGFNLYPAVDEQVPDDIYRDHVGIHPQKQAGLSYVGASVLEAA